MISNASLAKVLTRLSRAYRERSVKRWLALSVVMLIGFVWLVMVDLNRFAIALYYCWVGYSSIEIAVQFRDQFLLRAAYRDGLVSEEQIDDLRLGQPTKEWIMKPPKKPSP